MSIADLKIGTRLGSSFGAVLLLALILIAVATSGLSRVGDLSETVVSQDWPKAAAASEIDTLMRSNGRRTLELLVFDDSAAREQAFATISENKKILMILSRNWM